MAEKTEDDLLFKEIEEDLRQDQLTKLFKAYGGYGLIAAVSLVVGVAGYQGWKTWDAKVRREGGERFAAAMALANANNPDQALRSFAAIAADGRAGYAMLARFQEARITAGRGDAAGAAKAYRALADDDALDPIYRALATILGVIQELDMPGADLKAAAERLLPLTADTSPWRWSAREAAALVAWRAGDAAKAEALLTALAADQQGPPGVRARAREMLSILGK